MQSGTPQCRLGKAIGKRFGSLSNRGFTLVELAIGMVIISLVLASVMGLVLNFVQSKEINESTGRLTLMRDRIIGYALVNSRLPSYHTGAGTDELTALAPQARDIWGKKYLYIYDSQMVRTDSNSLICAKKTTNLLLRYCDDALCLTPRTQTNVAFVVFSTGKNLVNQTGASASPHTESVSSDPSESGPDGTPASPRTITIYGPGTPIGSYATPTTSAIENDDILYAVTLEDLRTKLNCVGNPLRIVNNDLPTGAASTAYSSTIYPEGGVPILGIAAGTYRWCVESATAATLSGIVITEVVTTSGSTLLTLSAPGDCSGAAESSWVVGNSFRVKGASGGASNTLNTTTAGTYDMTVYVRDDQNPNATVAGTPDLNDNIVSRKYVLGINGT